MKFWDSSALVPLLVKQSKTKAVVGVFRQDPVQAVWWGSEIECVSAISRLERNAGFPTLKLAEQAHRRLRKLRGAWQEIQPIVEVRETALRLLRVHVISAADAIQLAAAFVLSERRPGTLEFVCLDDRLSQAAQREGFICVF